MNSRRRSFLLALALSALFAGAPARSQTLYVCALGGAAVDAYDASTGGAVSVPLVSGVSGTIGAALFGNHLYVASYSHNVIGEYDATSGAVQNASFITGVTNPVGLALSGNRLFVANSTTGTVGVYNATTGEPLNPALLTGLGTALGAVAVSGNTLYVADATSNTVYICDASTGEVLTSITGLSGPHGIAVSGNNLLISNLSSGIVGEYNASTGAAINPSFITGLNEPYGLAVSGNNLYVSQYGNNTVALYHLSDGSVANGSFITGVANPTLLALSYAGFENISQLSSPAPATTLASGNVTFTWTPGNGGVTENILWVGSSPGAYDLFSGVVNGGSQSVTLPSDGRRIFARLYSQVEGQFEYNAYCFNAFSSGSNPKAAIQTPLDGSTLTSGSVSFNWSSGTGVTEVILTAGSSVSASDLYAAVETTNSATVALPTDGRPVYVTLYSKVNGAFEANHYTYTAAISGAAAPEALITSPANASILFSSPLNIQWTPGSGATKYLLLVGSTPRGFDLYAAALTSGACPSIEPPLKKKGQLDGRRIYVTLYSLVNGAWQPVSYYYDTTLTWNFTSEYVNPAQ